MRPRGPRLPRDSALDAMKDILDIRRGVFETVHGRKQKTTRTQAHAGNHDAGKTEPKMVRNSAKMAEEQPRPGHGLLPSRRAAVHRSTGVPSITQMASTPLLVRPDVATKTHAPIPKYGQIGKLLREAFSKAPLSLSPCLSLPCPPSGSDLMRINCDRQKGRPAS